MENNIKFHDNLKNKMDNYVHSVYKLSQDFPMEERFGVKSQLRRSTLSVILNYIEGYARRKDKVYKNFLEISYGSLKESEYLLTFSKEEKYITDPNLYKETIKLADEIGAMLWKTLDRMN